MNIFRNIVFAEQRKKAEPLRIEGAGDAPLTPEPDDAELAAQALLEMMSEKRRSRLSLRLTSFFRKNPSAPEKGTAGYYRNMSERVRNGHAKEAEKALRYVSYCEQELKKMVDGSCQLPVINYQLMKHIDTVEREGGELKRRWQHCLTEVTIRLMKSIMPMPDIDSKDNHTTL